MKRRSIDKIQVLSSLGSLLGRLFKLTRLDKSQVECPEWISPDAIIQKSKVTGKVVVGAHSKILESHISGNTVIGTHSMISGSRIWGNIVVRDHSKILETQLSGNVSIGRWTSINGPNTSIFTHANQVKIGNFCSIARSVSIQEYDHNSERLTTYFIMKNFFGDELERDIISEGDIVIGSDVWIGAQSVVLSGATISDGVVVGANSVVRGFIPPYAVIVGSPAKVIRYRFSEEIIERLLNLLWWNWDDEKIRENRDLFEGPLAEEKLDKAIQQT